tara:strand:+ start:1535 stop:2548 length:1014 start_codon:yes stop_codon:yes gene_type:complete
MNDVYTELFKKPELEPEILDRSFLQKYADCPFQAQAKCDTPAELKEVGKEVHRLIEEAIKAGGGSDMMADYFVEELPKCRPDIQPKVIEAAKWVGDQLANAPLHKIYVDPETGELAVEYQIDFALPVKKNGRPVKITTCVDLLLVGHNNLIVYDWKTGYKKRSNYEAYSDFQTQFITYILWQLFPKIETVHFFYKETMWGTVAYARLDRNKEHPRLPHLTTERAFEGRIMEAVRLWMAGATDAWPEPKKCTWCDAILKCPYADTLARDINKDPVAFVDHMVVIETLLKQNYIKTANEYVKKYGPIRGSKSVYEWRKPKRKFSPKLYKAEEEPNDGEE